MTQNSLPSRRFYRFDPIARSLVEKLHISPIASAILSVFITLVVYVLAAWISNTLWLTTDDRKGLLQDQFPWVLIFLIHPVVVGYYLWSFKAIDAVLDSLEKSDVLQTDEAEISKVSFNIYRQKWRNYLALVSAAGFSFFVFTTRSGISNSWTSSAILPSLVSTVATFIIVYMGSILVLNLIANIWILHQVVGKKELKINPLHPDRCGGLRSLSDYSLKTAYLAAILGIQVGLIQYQFFTQGNWQKYSYVQLIVPLHILLTLTCFFGPLLAAHSGMKRAKDDLLAKIASQFQADYSQIHSTLAGDAEVLRKGSEKIKELQAFYALTKEFPVWPFDVGTFRRFLITIPAPLIPIFFAILQKLIEAWLKKLGLLA